MDLKDVLFILAVLIFYTVSFLIYSAAGVVISGNKVKKIDDLFHPLSQLHKSEHGARRKLSTFFIAYYILFFVLLLLSIPKLMSLRSSFRAWIDRILGRATEDEINPAITVSDENLGPSSSRTNDGQIKDTGSTTTTTSAHRLQNPRHKTPPQKRVIKKEKMPNVLRASVVSPENQVIPPLPRLSIKEDTADKLSKVLSKLENIESEEGRRKTD